MCHDNLNSVDSTEVIRTDSALQDLNDIGDYIVKDYERIMSL